MLCAKGARKGHNGDVLVIVVPVPNTLNVQSLGGHGSCTLELCCFP